MNRTFTSSLRLVSAFVFAALACSTVHAQSGVIGGSVELGPVSTTYFQPKPVINEEILASLLTAVPGPIVIGVDDVLHLSLDGASPYDTDVRVERDGTIQLSYLKPMYVAGLTVSEVERKIDQALIDQSLVIDPAIKVALTQQASSVVVISGEVLKPGAYPTVGGLTLDHALAASGGVLVTAAPYAMLTRKGMDAPVLIPLGPSPSQSRYGAIKLFNGDHVAVLRAGTYYIVGAVKNQGAYPLKSTTPTTVSEALAAAGGYGFEGILDSTTIVRTEGDHRVLLKVHAGKILAGKAADVALLNDDIIFVPTSKTKAALKSGAAGLIVSLASTYIYAHP